MKATLQPDPIRASLTLYYVVALNHSKRFRRTINKKEAAAIISELLGIDVRAPKAWLRGNFQTHPISRENFFKFTRRYLGKPGLESSDVVRRVAIDLFGMEYLRVIELLGISDTAESGKALCADDLPRSIIQLIEESPPEEIKRALLELGRNRKPLNGKAAD